jgi:two-component system, cell cycle sensor histidine kinase and response regulator CckA
MIDIILEAIRVVVVCAIFVIILAAGKKKGLSRESGWGYIRGGFALLLFGVVIDFSDNFEQLNSFLIVGDTIYQAFFEKVVGYLGGFVLIAIGFCSWLPKILSVSESQQKFEKVFESAPAPMIISDAETLKLVDVNKAAISLYEVDSKFEMIGKSLTELSFYQDLEEKDKYIVTPLLEKGFVRNLEIRARSAKGNPIHGLFSAEVVHLNQKPMILSSLIDISERKNAEEQIKISESLYRTLFNHIVDPIFIFDKSTLKFLDVNQTALERYGYSLDEFRTMTPHQLHPSEELEKVNENIVSEDITYHEYSHVTRRGEIFIVEIHTTDFKFDGQDAWISIVRDITDRRKSEQALRQNEENYRRLFENVPDLYFELDANAVVTSINESFLKDYAYEPSDIIGHSFTNFIHPDDVETIMQGFLESMADHVDHDHGLLFRLIDKDGQAYWCELNANMKFDEEGNYLQAFGAVRNINERKKAEDEMRKLMSLIENSQDFIGFSNLEGDIQYVNAAGLRMVGLDTVENARNLTIFDLVPEQISTVLENDALPLILSNKHWINQTQFQSVKTGNPFPIEINAFLITRTDASEPNAIAIVGRDLTDRQSIEEQLRQSQRMESLGTMAGGIAHDFNNILGTMLGYLDLLTDRFDDESTEKDYLAEIYQAGERATGLVKQILTFSRVNTHTLKPQKIQTILIDSLKFVKATLPSSISVQVKIDHDCRPALANGSQIEQVIINLCTNAAHAMKGSDGTLLVKLAEVQLDQKVESQSDLPDGTYVCLTIEDSGTGMTEDTQKRIFEPFFTTKEINEGTGLGLSVVHGIIENHQGFIEVDSKLGEGTCVQIYLPVTKLEPTPVGEDQEKAERGKGRLLVVDDEAPLAHFYALALGKLGYEVTEVHDSSEALQQFREHADDFDLVLTDQIMPHMTGLQLCEEILKIKPKIPVVLITGHPQGLASTDLQSSRITGFLHKPVKIRILAQEVQKAIKTNS